MPGYFKLLARRVVVLTAVAAVTSAMLASGCTVDPLTGCQSNDDCRFGRICRANTCVWPPGGGAVLDQGGDLDVGPDEGDGTDELEVDRDATGRGRLTVTPDPVDFGTISPGAERVATVTVRNSGDGPLAISEVRLRETSIFELVNPPLGEVLPEGDSVTFVVRASVAPGTRPGTAFDDVLTVQSDVGSRSIEVLALSGEGDVCLRSPGPERVNVEVDEARFVELPIENCGGVSVELESVEVLVDGQSAAVEVESLPEPQTLGPGDSVVAVVEVAGREPGRTTLRLTVRYRAGGSLGRLNLSLVIEVGAPCDIEPELVVEPDGPRSRDGSLEVDYGARVRVEPPETTTLASVLFATLPDGSAPPGGGRTGDGDWLIVPERPGLYQFTTTIDAVGANGEVVCTGVFDQTLVVNPPPALWAAWLVWDEPFANRVIDLDLYVARQTEAGAYLWDSGSDAVGPTSANADWGVPGQASDNPSYLFDYNTQGWGPEQVRILEPNENETYAIGVHAFSVPFAGGVAAPRVFVWLGGGELIGPLSVDLREDGFWIVAESTGLELLDTYEVVVDGFPPPSDLP